MAEIKEVSQEEIKQAKREYMKEYRSKNKEKFKEYQNRWYAKRAAAAKKSDNLV
ncbi:phosphatase [Clostridium beijerinckii]|uniref:Uncharacterized protein n=1 Tax=Clostridium beijerinckii TaxID=1520 RepID=A0AAX0BAM3_CLOBE|nr:phosphatase [Clostridium beijerinckii]NRT92263.1 hypothetical protein [Clostridium beijerinckii]NYC75594.1 hypothetical protein [Clostridium beijerinckii]